MTSLDRGELICFATNTADLQQVAFNELSGTATPIREDDTQSSQPKEAYRYNAWAFAALTCVTTPGGTTDSATTPCTADGVAADNPTAPFGSSGTLQLDGMTTPTTIKTPAHYDICPNAMVQPFMSNGASLGATVSGASYGLTLFENDLHAVSCYQDLRAQYLLHLTKLTFNVWNGNEASTAAFECSDSVITLNLLGKENPSLVNPSAFDKGPPGLGTDGALFALTCQLDNTNCPGAVHTSFPPAPDSTENMALLSVVSSDVGVPPPFPSTSRTNQTGGNSAAQGAFPAKLIDDPSGLPGFVVWDPGTGGPNQH